MTMQQQALEPNAVMITTTDEVLCIDKEEQLSQSNALPKKSNSSPLMVDSFSPKSLPNKTKNKPIIPPHKKDTRKLFVGGLGKQVNNENFKHFFEQYGTVIDSIVMIDRETNRHRGFGFVTFQDPNVAEKVLSMGNEGQTTPEGGWKSGKIEIFGKVCEVKASEPKKGGQGHLSSCKSSCSSETSGGLLVPTDIQFQNYYNSGSSIQQQGMNVGGAPYNNNVVSQVTASSCAPFVSSTHQEITTAESSSAAADMDGYSSVLNMGQVNPIPSYPSSTYPHATDMMYYAGPYPPYYYSDNAMCHPYFYSYQLPDTTNVHGTSLPANYYYPMTGDFVMNHDYGTSYLYPMTPPSLYNAESSGHDYATTTFSITNPQSSTKKSLEKKPVKSGNHPSNVEAKEQKQ